ncbi:MAG: tetratricopeptide repeat protein, partial [Methyloligellaceae bacterium]
PVYMRQQRFAEAADAFGKALRLLGRTPKRLTDFGIATVFANGGVVSEPARQALQQAVTGDPSLVEAHFWLAVAKEQDGRFVEAANDWRALLKRGDASAPWRPMVKQRLAELEQREGITPTGKDADGSAGNAIKGPTREDIAAAKDMTPTDRAAMIKQMVAGLAERLKNDGGEVEEWQRLVRSYTVLGDKRAARKALDDARRAFAEDPGALASLGELANQLGL